MKLTPTLTLLAEATETSSAAQDASSTLVLASIAIVMAAIVGLLAGFFLGTTYGRMSGELKMLKSVKSDRSRKHRSRSRERSDGVEHEAVH